MPLYNEELHINHQRFEFVWWGVPRNIHTTEHHFLIIRCGLMTTMLQYGAEHFLFFFNSTTTPFTKDL